MNHDELARNIAENGRTFAQENLTLEMFYEHAFYVLSKYAEYQSKASIKHF